MKSAAISSIALFISLLIITLPISHADTLSLIYDRNGNLITGDGLYREFNSLNQLVKIRNGSNQGSPLLEMLEYHPVEERVLVKKVYDSSETLVETVIYVSSEFVIVKNDSGTFNYTYVKHEGQRVAELRPDGTKLFIHPDNIGSSVLVSNSSGEAVENTSYTPYGLAVEGVEQSRYSYEGQEFDSVVEDYDFHFRKYKADWGIFTQPDTLLPNVYDPQQLNRYAFERGNPYGNVDPTGHDIFESRFDLEGPPDFRISEDAPVEEIYEAKVKAYLDTLIPNQIRENPISMVASGSSKQWVNMAGDLVEFRQKGMVKIGETDNGEIYRLPNGDYYFKKKYQESSDGEGVDDNRIKEDNELQGWYPLKPKIRVESQSRESHDMESRSLWKSYTDSDGDTVYCTGSGCPDDAK